MPQLVKGSADTARACYRGQFTFAGLTADAGGNALCKISPPSDAWAEALHGFEWLTHLAAQQASLERVYARNLVTEWVANRRAPVGNARHVVARRLINAATYAPFLIDGASSMFEKTFYCMIEDDAARLLKASAPATDLLPAIALGYAVNAFRSTEHFEAPALARLERALEHWVLPDGAHASRSPLDHLKLLLDLLPLRMAMGARRAPIPQAINAAIERMLPMLRFYSLGDGGLALFHGAGQPMTAEVKAVLDQDSSFGRPLNVARYANYARIAHGRVALVMDCGGSGVSDSDLALEISDGVHRMIVNCGMPANPSANWARSARCAAAHSAVEFPGAAPVRIEPCKHSGGDAGSMASARRSFSQLVHGRDVFLASSGGDLRGEDHFSFSGQPQNEAFAIRFHLHPSVKATLARDLGSVVLQLPDRTGWRFSARGASLALEESVYFGCASGARKSEQIVIRGNAADVPSVKWAMRRIEKREKAVGAKSDNPLLPF